jgi:hypothetical protein
MPSCKHGRLQTTSILQKGTSRRGKTAEKRAECAESFWKSQRRKLKKPVEKSDRSFIFRSRFCPAMQIFEHVPHAQR